MAKHQRKKLFVDAKVQGTLLVRTVYYWSFSLVALIIMLLIWRSVAGAVPFWAEFDYVWSRYAPVVVASMFLLPLVLTDVVRLSNRFAGPIYRMRREMQAVARGETVGPIHFRKGDFWHEFADDFNTMLAQIQLRTEAQEASTHPGAEATTSA